MKKAFLLIVTSALLVSLGFAQTPPAGSNTDQVNVKGCLGGSDGNYTVTEDGTRQIFKITTSAVELKLHVGHDVELIGHKASGTPSSSAADNSFVVTELNMISEHCAAAATAPAATVSPASPATTPPAPPADAPAPTAAAPAPAAAAPAPTAAAPAPAAAAPAPTAAAPAPATNPASPVVGAPPAEAAAPAATASSASVTATAPASTTASPAAPASPSSAAVSTHAEAPAPSPSSPIIITEAADDARPTRLSAHHRRPSATQAAATTVPDATATPSSEPVTPPAAATAAPAADAGPPPQAASAAVAATPTVTHKGWSLPLLISAVVVIIVLGTLAPLFGRWRKRKMLEKTGEPNLSFTKEASTNAVNSDQDTPESRRVA